MHSISFSCGIVTIFAVRVRIARAAEGCATHHNSPLIEAEVCVFEGNFFFEAFETRRFKPRGTSLNGRVGAMRMDISPSCWSSARSRAS